MQGKLFKAAIIFGDGHYACTPDLVEGGGCQPVTSRPPQSGMMERGRVLFYLPCIKENSPRHRGEPAKG